MSDNDSDSEAKVRCKEIYSFAANKAVRVTYADIRSVLNVLDVCGGGGSAQVLGPSAWDYLRGRDDDLDWFTELPPDVQSYGRPNVRHQKAVSLDIDELVFARKHGWYQVQKAAPWEYLYPPMQPDLPGQEDILSALPTEGQNGLTSSFGNKKTLLADLLEQAALPSMPEVYSPLPDSSWFRLLIVEPGAADDPVTCRLVPVPISRAKELRYDALSYVWDWWGVSGADGLGDHVKGIHSHVFCNGVDIEVKANIWEALYYLRRSNEPCILWADAFCINQDDDGERAMQVAMMGQIYSAAARTLVWLGSKDEGAREAFDLVCGIVRAWDDQLPASYEVHGETTGSSALACGMDSASAVGSLTEKDLQQLMKLFTNPWFSRRWVIQENLSGNSSFITPDYSMDEVQLCRFVAERWLESRDAKLPLKFLSDAGDNWTKRYKRSWRLRKFNMQGPAAAGPCPSWVPRWKDRETGMLGHWTIGDDSQPEGALPFQRYETASPDCLQVRGMELSTIVWCGQGIDDVSQWVRKMMFGSFFCAGEADDPALDRIGFLARTLCAGRTAYGSKVRDGGAALARHLVAYMLASPDDGDEASRALWKKRQSQLGPEEGDARAFEQLSDAVCRGRSLFVTSGGHLGLCSRAVWAGDSVCVLGGAIMPFVLRPRSLGGGDAGTDGFTLVGECYVDGIMENEAVEAMRRGGTHRGPMDARKVMMGFYKFPKLDDKGREEMAALIDKTLELADKKYERLEAAPISIY
ncbi:hypothetical protein RB593_001509 [Gaeumannomyces tritici]